MFNCIKNCLFYLIKNKQMTNPGLGGIDIHFGGEIHMEQL